MLFIMLAVLAAIVFGYIVYRQVKKVDPADYVRMMNHARQDIPNSMKVFQPDPLKPNEPFELP